MKRLLLALSLVSSIMVAAAPLASAGPKAPPPAKAPVVQVVHLAAPGAATFAVLLDAEVKKARAAHLQPYLQFSADWCKPCLAFKHYIDDPAMRDAMDGVYLIVASYDDWEKEATKLGVIGIPTWIEVNAAGQPAGRHLSSDVWGEDVPANMAPPLKAYFHPHH
jgi:thiol:disulfide interchange protein